MCGVVGYFGEGSREQLAAMAAKIARRGPDAEGFWEGSQVGLGHRRLSILDLTPTGAQPMVGGRGVALAFNGEIYNFAALRAELEQGGATFAGRSDTEVLLALYERDGVAAFPKLSGMFAVALYDPQDDTFVLATDRAGKKPLFYASDARGVVVSSELTSLLASGRVARKVDPQALNEYLVYGFVPSPRSLVAGVRKVEPSTTLVFRRGQLEPVARRYAALQFEPKLELAGLAADDALESALDAAVQARLVADVPVGVFLSGGIDSSLVAALAARSREEPISTFSIGFGEASYDESPYARLVAEALGTKHREQILSPDEAARRAAGILGEIDEPIADASLVPTRLLAELARREVTVALGGDGADEIFGGYGTFLALRVAKIFRAAPLALRRLARRAALALPPRHGYMNVPFLAERFTRGHDLPLHVAHQRWIGPFSDERRRGVLTAAARGALSDELAAEPIERALVEATAGGATDDADRLAAVFFRTYMRDDILVKVDRATMAVGLEARAPFLDDAVVDLALRLPWAGKRRGTKGKIALRRLAKKLLPAAIGARRKHGFAIPVSSWLRGPLAEIAERALFGGGLARVGWLDLAAVEALWRAHRAGERDFGRELWALLALGLWAEENLA